MKPGIASALVLAVVLIGGASLYRFSGDSPSSAGLIAVGREQMSDEQYEDLLNTFLETTDSGADAETLTATDMIGRQLILDYVDLARGGAASSENLDLLAERYVESIPTLSPSLQINYSDIKSVANTQANLEKYSQEVTVILTDYQKDYLSLSNQKGIDLSVLNATTLAFFGKISAIYENNALKLQAVETPESFVLLHHQLINTYLTNSAAMEAIAMNDTDSAKAFAGIIAMNEGIAKEKEVIGEMNKILATYGL